MNPETLKIGISSCLLGEKVRWDGDHRREAYLAGVLGRYVSWVPVCPEVETGMGVPRETVQLVGTKNPRMVGTHSGKDWTGRMNRFAQKKVKALAKLELSGFVLKRGSPSCGLNDVVLRTPQGKPAGQGSGLFAEALLRHFPGLPVEDEARLSDPEIRENFIVRIFAFSRLKRLFRGRWKRAELVRFHASHKYLLLAHSPGHYKKLGRLAAEVQQYAPKALQETYGGLFMEALSRHATRPKNAKVLQPMLGFFKGRLSAGERREMLSAIRDYEKGLVPLLVPAALVRHYAHQFNIGFLKDQVYLNPHPDELMLRNHA